MTRRTAMVAAVAAALTFAAPAAADPAPPPREKALDAYSALYHKCKDVNYCTAGRNIRRQGVKFKWVSEENTKDRHWGTRPPTAEDIADEIRELREDTAPRYYAGAWAIPTAIVMCESHGTNAPPNYASASGYYQILTSTWLAQGGGRFAPQAYLASRAEQDIIARRIWNTGGPSQWVCAGIVGIG